MSKNSRTLLLQASGARSQWWSSSGLLRLTTFVLRSFAKAEAYIYIDQAKMAETKTWVAEKQQENGCYQMVGSLFNKAMKVSR